VVKEAVWTAGHFATTTTTSFSARRRQLRAGEVRLWPKRRRWPANGPKSPGSLPLRLPPLLLSSLQFHPGIIHLQATPRSHGRPRFARPAVTPPGAPPRFTPRPDMQAGRASAVGPRSAAFSGRTFPSMRPGRPGPWLFRIRAVLSVCQFQQRLSAMMRLPPTERASALLSVTSAPRRANLEPS
jgi:hypothetical protein